MVELAERKLRIPSQSTRHLSIFLSEAAADYSNFTFSGFQVCSEARSSTVQRGHQSSSIPHLVGFSEREVRLGIFGEASKVGELKVHDLQNLPLDP